MDRPASCAGANADLSCTWNHLDIAAEAVLALDGNRKMEDTAMSNLLPPPERCQTTAEVRAAIDTLTHAIITLLSDRKSVVSGKSVSVRVDLDGRRIMKIKKKTKTTKKK